MKKWIFVVVLVLAALVAWVYFYIPDPIDISATTGMTANAAALQRKLAKPESWSAWWPGNKTDSGTLEYEGIDFSLQGNLFQAISIDVRYRERTIPSRLIIIPLGNDSLRLEWGTTLSPDGDLLNGYQIFRQARDLEERMDEILQALKIYASDSRHLYEYDIRLQKVTDSIILMATRKTSLPLTAAQLDNELRALKAYASQADAQTTNAPMLHVDSADGSYLSRIGIPIDREIPETADMQIKRMVLGSILVTEVSGGPHSIKQALKQTELFISDHELRSPAIPYESMVTDRAAQPDTAQWKTVIYYPVI